MRSARLLLVLALAAVGAGFPVPPASGHTGDNLAKPILEKIEPKGAEKLEVQVLYTANFQFLVTNPTPTELTILAKAGEPFIRIGPEGVFGNFKSKSWYNSNSPDGLQKYPEGSADGPDTEPVWRKVAKEPTWGWFDHRLHPVERYLQKQVLESVDPVKLGEWTVPTKFGDENGALKGRFEYKPSLGRYETVLRSSEKLADGITVKVASAQRVPSIYIENTSAKTVTVLGKEGEPFIRIGPAVEYNLYSPSYVEIQQARNETPPLPADASAPPEWREVQKTPRWAWLEFRAAPPAEDPPKEVALRETPTVVRTWKVPVMVGDEPQEVVGVTQFVPIAQVREQARGGQATGGDGGLDLPPILLGVVAVTGLAGYVVLKPKKKEEAPGEVRHRSRATPKVKR